MGELTGMVKFRGRVGDTVGYRSNGRNLIRQAPKKQGEAKTEGQKRQRNRFSELVPIASAVNSWDKRYLTKLKVSAYNNFISVNADYLHKQEADESSIRFPHTFFAKAITAEPTLTGRTVSFTLPEFVADVSEVLAVVYVSKTNAKPQAFTATYSEPGAKTFDIPLDIVAGDTIYVFLQGGNGKDSLTSASVSKLIAE